jgi:hypothetical protein
MSLAHGYPKSGVTLHGIRLRAMKDSGAVPSLILDAEVCAISSLRRGFQRCLISMALMREALFL